MIDVSILIGTLAGVLDPSRYLQAMGNTPYQWQDEALDPTIKRLLLLCARQAGKSSVVAGKVTHRAKYTPRSLNIIISPSRDQSAETMLKVEDFIYADKDLVLVKDSTFEKRFTNGSRIVALPGTERSVRGYSGPHTIIVDEAARVLDSTYYAIRPMLTDNEDAELIILSTPFGKRGFFHHAWEYETMWKKIYVKPGFIFKEKKVVPDIPEAKFKAIWKEKGVSAYYSPRHKKKWLEEEREVHPDIWLKQEYGCEFMAEGNAFFHYDDIMAAFTEDVTPLLKYEEENEEELGEVIERLSVPGWNK